MAQRAANLPGAAARPRGRYGVHAVTVAVAVIGVGIVGTLAVVTFRGHSGNEARLLSLQARLTAAAVAGADPLFIEDHLGGAASLAAATNGAPGTFMTAMSSAVTARGPFITASLWRVGIGEPRLVTAVGAKPLIVPGTARAATLFRAAVASRTFAVTTLGTATAERIGYAAAAPARPGSFVVYAEVPLPANRHVPPPKGPFSQLNIAVYLGHTPSQAALLETDSAAPLPLRGTTSTTTIPFGNTVLTLTASARTSLSGSLGVYLPWAIGIGGVLLTILVALLTERLIRRREGAERLTDDLGRLLIEQRSVAETLQHALLPQQMPVIPGMEIAVRYLPGAQGIDIGGDWYDVVPLDGDKFVFIVGDVSGRGVRAAGVMASLHFASRAYALEGHPPAAILGNLSRALDIEKDGHFAAVLCGLVDVGSHEIMLANAGHLPPVLCIDSEASVAQAHPGAPIGIADGSAFESAKVTAAAKATLIAYTDGLVERRGESLDDGIKRLEDAVCRDAASLDALLTSIVTDLTGDSPTDDIALIGLRWLD